MKILELNWLGCEKNGPRCLPKINYKDKSYYYDSRLKELRDVETTMPIRIRASEAELLEYAIQQKDERLVKINMEDFEEQGYLQADPDCPKCGRQVWDVAKGPKLNKCWECKTAFD